MNLLVVDDDELTRRYLQIILHEHGHQVDTAADGLEAISKLRNKRISVVITDWVMPEVDGLELIRVIRSSTTNSYIYIIMMTVKSDKKDLIKAMETGADAFIKKPVDPDELNVSLMSAKRVIDLEIKLSAKNVELEQAYTTIKNDLEAAGKIQKSLLPAKPPEAEKITFDWLFKPHTELGGDIFGVFNLDPSLLGIYMIDVSGNGVEAALLAVTLSRMLTPLSDYIFPLGRMNEVPRAGRILGPSEIANLLNARFYDDEANYQFFTLLYGTINTDSMTFSYTTAGHRGIIFSGEKTYAISDRSFPICFTGNPQYGEKLIHLAPKDRLFFFTDGLYESVNEDGQQFGIERMVATIEKSKSDSLRVILNTLYAEAKAWCYPNPISDDVSALALEVEGGRRLTTESD